MALPNNGRIDMDGLIAEFRHPSNPAPINHFYRGGAYVPSQIPGIPIPAVPGGCVPSGGVGSGSVSQTQTSPAHPTCPNRDGWWQCFTPIGAHTYIVAPTNVCSSPYTIMYSCGRGAGYTGRGTHPSGSCTLQNSNYQPPVPEQPGIPVPINGGVPTSGKLALDNFYGAYKG